MIIGITGKAGSGKDTVANIIMDTSERNFVKYSFAEPLKNLCSALFYYLVDDYFYDTDMKEHNVKVSVSNKELYHYQATIFYFMKNHVWPKGLVSIVQHNQAFELSLALKDLIKQYGQKSGIFSRKYWISPRILLQVIGTELFREKVDNNIWINIFHQFVENNPNVIVSDMRFVNEAYAIKQQDGITIKVKRDDYDNNLVLDSHSSEKGIDEINEDITLVNNLPDLIELEEYVINTLPDSIFERV